MKKIILIVAICGLSACANHQNDQKSGWFFGMLPPLEWPARHWKGQDFQPSINPESSIMNQSVSSKKSMFQSDKPLSAEELSLNLKNSDIIRRVYSRTEGSIFRQEKTQTAIVELGPNFYTLSYADKRAITQLLSKAYQQDHFMMTDWKTGKTVGQITKDSFLLF